MKEKRRIKIPLWIKALLVIILTVFATSMVAVVFSSNRIKSITREHYITRSTEIGDTLALYVNKDDVKALQTKVAEIYASIPETEKVCNTEWGTPEWETYLTKYNAVIAMPEYDRVMNQIVEFHTASEAKSTCIAYADFEERRIIYIVDDSAPEERCLPGSFDEFTASDMSIIGNVDAGFKPEISNSAEYGYIVSVGRPIYDVSHNLIAFTIVDLSMDKIVAEENNDARTLTLILLGIGLGATAIGYLLVLFLIIRPIRKLTKTANEFATGNNESINKFANIHINTRDEIEDLSNSMKKMEEDINHYISDLFGAERKANELKYLADRDALTGVMNKRSYFEEEERLNNEIKNGKTQFSICMIDLNDLKVTNDTLGHEKGDELIIAVSSAIKNVFKSSKIYRIGGDEFAIISENEDYQNIDDLRLKFVSVMNKAFESNEHLSAAIGVAKYNQEEDNNVEDVFKRADSEMYKTKKKMKSTK